MPVPPPVTTAVTWETSKREVACSSLVDMVARGINFQLVVGLWKELVTDFEVVSLVNSRDMVVEDGKVAGRMVLD